VDVLRLRQLSRAGLERQLLLARADLPVTAAVDAVAGLQAQAPNAPYVALWSGLRGFDAGELATALLDRRLVRTPLLRGTIHLVSADAAVAWYPLVRPVLERGFAANFARRLPGVDLETLLSDCEKLLVQPHTRAQLGAALAPRWPSHDRTAMAYAATYLLPVVQVPPRGVWGDTAQATWTNTATWLGTAYTADPSPDRMIIRHLAAFGPATVRDMQTWCGLTRLHEVVERLDLRGYRDENGTELFDVPDGTIPDPDTPAPPRFLAEYDNLLLSYADRARVGVGQAVPLPPGIGGVTGTVLDDGFWRATWHLNRTDDRAILVIEPFERLSDPSAITEEAMRLLDFIAGDVRHDVLITEP
jgi:hypothetical protein